jgi:transcriptional regulator GlxA family with amidase domain
VLEKGLFSMKETLAHLDRALARSARLGGEGRRVVRKAMAFVHEHHAEPIGRADIARHACVGERHLDRYFRDEADITPMKYLNRYRVRQAKTLLLESDRSVTDVALEVGFSGGSYFGEIFRRETGMSPREFRERGR